MLQTIQSFLLDLEIKGRADNTIKNYQLQLRTFYSWCTQTDTDYLSLTPRQAKHYRDALYSTGLSGKTINTMIGTLRTFYEYLMEEELVQGNPILKNLRIREEPRYPAPLNEEEKHIVLEALESKEQHINLAFKTMLATGIRVGEAAKLTRKDIRLDSKRVVLFIRKAKGGKSRMVPIINREVALQLYEYSKEIPEGEPLFRVTKRTIQGHAERIKKNTGVNFYSHRARHTYATSLLAKDTRLDIIQREGTQASLVDILEEDDVNYENMEKNVEEVVNYVNAMNYGIKRLNELPLCLRLIKEIHNLLLQGVRGSERNPGEFRKSQNWIGPAGCTLATATFVPPPVLEMQEAMNNFEMFIHTDDEIPPLIKIGLLHAQFETIHPFLDGNGRMGRLLITFWLYQQKILTKPLLYLSYYFKKNRMEYYDRLMDIRVKGDWEGWMKFFLKGIAEVSDEATNTAKHILKMKDLHTEMIKQNMRNPSNGLKLLERLFESPIVTINKVAEMLDVSYPTASNLVNDFCDIGLLKTVSKVQRNKKFSYYQYIEILQAGTELQ
ncbi:MAG: Fic family protein [Caldicoprobacterales bacterium]|jgi:Fic family protein